MRGILLGAVGLLGLLLAPGQARAQEQEPIITLDANDVALLLLAEMPLRAVAVRAGAVGGGAVHAGPGHAVSTAQPGFRLAPSLSYAAALETERAVLPVTIDAPARPELIANAVWNVRRAVSPAHRRGPLRSPLDAMLTFSLGGEGGEGTLSLRGGLAGALWGVVPR